MQKYVYLVYGRVYFHDNVWGTDGLNYFGECPLLNIFENYDKAKKFYLSKIYEAISALNKEFRDTEYEHLIEHMEKSPFKSYIPADDAEMTFELIASEKQDLEPDKEDGEISWSWYAFNWDENIYPSPIMPCIMLKRIKIE